MGERDRKVRRVLHLAWAWVVDGSSLNGPVPRVAAVTTARGAASATTAPVRHDH